MGDLTQKTASEIAALTARQNEIAVEQNKIIGARNEAATATKNAIFASAETAGFAEGVKFQYGENSSQYQAAKEAEQIADAEARAAKAIFAPLNAKNKELTANWTSLDLQKEIVAASPQNTSPAPSIKERESTADAVGSAAGSLGTPNPPNPPTASSLPPIQYDPTTNRAVTPYFLGGSSTAPDAPKTQETVDPDAGSSVNVTIVPAPFKLLSAEETGQDRITEAQVDPNQQQPVNSETTPAPQSNPLAADIQKIIDSPVQTSNNVSDQPQKQETIPANSGEIPTVDLITGKTSVEERISPASNPSPSTQVFDDGSSITVDSTTGQQTVVDADGNVTITGEIPQAQQTVEATNSDDPLGDKIAELQAGQNTGTSTLPTRNQQSGIGSPKDWRFRISLAPGATYLYKDSSPGILKPLMATNGVIFPYSPQINLAYTASYNATDLVHTNYKVYNYKSSSVENISINGDFTVQDSAEANYVLAVIHFFRSVTKMFYGQDQNPARGVPPPLCYLTGFGQYQFDMHPVAITSFTYTFPNDVDYVNAYPTNNSVSIGGQNMAPYMPQIASFFSPLDRLRTLAGNIGKGGLPPPPTFVTSKNINEVTRVPAKITIQLSCIPIVSRNTMSNQFSLKQYANGSLLKGTANFSRTGGGLW